MLIFYRYIHRYIGQAVFRMIHKRLLSFQIHKTNNVDAPILQNV